MVLCDFSTLCVVLILFPPYRCVPRLFCALKKELEGGKEQQSHNEIEIDYTSRRAI